MKIEEQMDDGGVEQWDLTSAVSPHLDRHMMFPLLEYLDTLIASKTISYDSKDVAAARLALLRPTHMVDYAIDTYKGVHPNEAVPEEMMAQKTQVFERLEELKRQCAGLDELCNNQEERAKLTASGQWSLAALTQLGKTTPEELETYRQLAKYKYDCGDYQASRDMLENYILLHAKPPAPAEKDDDDATFGGGGDKKTSTTSSSTETGDSSMYYLTAIDTDMLQVLWGKLACEILVEDWEAASVAVEAVKSAMEKLVSQNKLTSLQALEQRTWLLHWSLFVFWGGGGLEQMVDLCFSEKYRQAITTNAPHLLRYLTAAVLLCKRRIQKKAPVARLMKSLIQVMGDCEYTDPIVDFVNCLCVKYDFDEAQSKLQECQLVLEGDFFLCKQTDLFMEEARVFVFENYCRIHNKIDLETLGEKLAMDPDQAERWIVDLLREADLDAKIDSSEKCVVMGGNPQSVYQLVMERTRDLNVRSATLAQNLNTVLVDARKEKAKKERESRED